jgi:glucose-6-phosphate dehydrogenase assembly protein OpcA
MPTYRDQAVVLRTHKLGEADRIVSMLSREHGKRVRMQTLHLGDDVEIASLNQLQVNQIERIQTGTKFAGGASNPSCHRPNLAVLTRQHRHDPISLT